MNAFEGHERINELLSEWDNLEEDRKFALSKKSEDLIYKCILEIDSEIQDLKSKMLKLELR